MKKTISFALIITLTLSVFIVSKAEAFFNPGTDWGTPILIGLAVMFGVLCFIAVAGEYNKNIEKTYGWVFEDDVVIDKDQKTLAAKTNPTRVFNKYINGKVVGELSPSVNYKIESTIKILNKNYYMVKHSMSNEQIIAK
jgi:hypothetical protein